MDRINVIDEYNDGGHLIYAAEYIGAYARGRTREEALAKLPGEIACYCRWLDIPAPSADAEIVIIQEKLSELQICDADSDIIFDSEKQPLTAKEYYYLRSLALRSAQDFLTLYHSIPDKTASATPSRRTFYGAVPLTADEMYTHTKNVNEYYFAEIELEADNEPDIYACRKRAFERLEQRPDFLANTVYDGSYGEQWSLRKLCRRFVWHDRIHAKAMYRMALRLKSSPDDPFCFGDII